MKLTKVCPDCGSDSEEVKRTDEKDVTFEIKHYVCTNENCPRSDPASGFSKRVRKAAQKTK